MTGSTLTDPPPTRAPEDRAAARRRKRAEAWAEAAGAGWKVWLVKIVCLGIIDAMALYAIFVLLGEGNLLVAAIIALGVIAINVVYLVPGMLPAKYLTPGLVFLFVFQIFVVLYCIYIAFTNYGSGHISTKDDAVNALLIQNQQRVEDSAAYPVSILEQNGQFFLLATTPDGDAEIGGTERPLEPAPDAEFSGDRAVSVPGYTTLDFSQIVANQAAITAIAVTQHNYSDTMSLSRDQFIGAMRSLGERARAGDEALKSAPHLAPRRRLDETLAARKPRLVWKD